MYHESFWVAITAAAPVIALASILAFTYVTDYGTAYLQWLIDHPYWTFPEEHQRSAVEQEKTIRSAGAFYTPSVVLNTIVQAAMLGFALTSLASRVDEMPTALAIAAEVGGIAILAICAVITSLIRNTAGDLMKLSLHVPDEWKSRLSRK